MRFALVAACAVAATLVAILLAVQVNFWLGAAVLVATVVAGVLVMRVLRPRDRR